jgi:prevent-host-death family protein
MVMSDVALPLAEIKKRLSEIVDGVERRHDRVVLTRHGRPAAAVIISPDELESLEETRELLSDPEAMREIREADSAVEAGEVVTADELRSTYLKR